MAKTVILEKRGEPILPITRYENVLGAPEITETISPDGKIPTSRAVANYVDNKFEEYDTEMVDSTIHVGDDEPEIKSQLWIDTTDDELDRYTMQSAVIESIQNAIYLLQQKVSKLMLMRTQGIISGSVTDSTLTELGNANEPVVPDIVADEEFPDVQYPEYAVESEPTVNHISVKMGTWSEIQAARRFFINGEMVWCTNRNTMYIYVNGNFKALASGSTINDDDDNNNEFNDDTMDTTQLQNYLDNLDSISFVPVNDENKKYTVKVNEYGNLVVYDSNNDSVLTTPSSRGLYFPGYSTIGQLIINSFYLGGIDNDEHSYQPCSHNFVEIANISYEDINLNGLCLMYTPDDITWYKLPLWGVCKAQSTFLIRGAQCSVMDVNTTKIKVKTFDMEWVQNGSLIKFDRGNQKAAFYLCWCDLEDDNKIYIMNGDVDTKVSTPAALGELILRDDGKAAYGYVDLVGVGSTSFYENKKYNIATGIDENSLFVRVYTLDPVTQSNAKGISSRNTAKFWRHVDLRGILVDNIEGYTPKASFEHKNLSFDKHNFSETEPNTLTCTFGIQATDNTASGGPGATRCFTWNSVGYYDEYLWFKKVGTDNWIKVESYKKGVDYSVSYRATDPVSVRSLYSYYTRIRWETFYGAAMTTHKVIVGFLTAGTYEYKVGRADENGNPSDYISKTRQFTVKADADVQSFDFIQVTDQQGANWEEYQVWDLSADFINRNERVGQTPVVGVGQASPGVNTKDFDFVINTGDITYNGSRPNEWIDYYAGYKYLDDKEEMLTIGNNDLAPVPENFVDVNDPDCVLGMQELGYGRERPDKVNHVVADLFYTQEMDPANPPIFEGTSIKSNATVTFKVPSLYSFNYGEFHYISLNSEIRAFYGDNDGSTVTAEFGVIDNGNGLDTDIYDKIEDWMVKDLLIWKQGSVPVSYDHFTPQNCQKAIVYCHEMPFTITAAATYKSYLDASSGSVYRESAKAQLNMKHNFKFQRLFKLWNIRLVFGGHKHTCSISMPIYDAPTEYIPYQYEDNRTNDCDALMQPLTGADTFNPIIQVVRTDNDAVCGLDAKIGTALEGFNQSRGKIFNSTNSSVTVNLQGGGSQTFNSKSVDDAQNNKPLCRYEIVDAATAPTYVMCQATGFKNLSNSDTSDGTEHCQWQRALVQGSAINSSTNKVDKVTPTDQLYPFYTRFRVTNSNISVEMHRVAGMYDPSSSAGYWNPNRDMPNGHEAKMSDLYRKPWASCEISLV